MEEIFFGIIYKIVPDNHAEGDIYIGSTKKSLCYRKHTHTNQYKQYKNGIITNKYCSSYKLFDKYGIDNCKFIEVKSIRVTSIDELHIEERKFIENERCVNIKMPHRTKEENSNTRKMYSNSLRKMIEEFKEFKQENEQHMTEDISNLDTKQCRVCNDIKPHECFRVASRRCKKCVSKINAGRKKDYMKKYYELNKEHIKEQNLDYYKTVFKPIREEMYEAKGISKNQKLLLRGSDIKIQT
jgi:hypothetical protein